jgi:hypothetical protein
MAKLLPTSAGATALMLGVSTAQARSVLVNVADAAWILASDLSSAEKAKKARAARSGRDAKGTGGGRGGELGSGWAARM